MRMYVGVTDSRWYQSLAREGPDEVNFWQPGGKVPFKALSPGEMFLFKMHSPINKIAGGGFFVRHVMLPLSLAWEAFGSKNGNSDYSTFRKSIFQYRKTDPKIEPDPTIGCIVLASPFFFAEDRWIPVPEDWKPNIVQGKTYDAKSEMGGALYHAVEERLRSGSMAALDSIVRDEAPVDRYGSEYITVPRLGQGGFRVMVTEAYHRRCAVTGEKTLPVLDAAHIRPYAEEGPHLVANGLLLRKDIHSLFDRGYLTVDDHFRIEVSRRIKEDYGNGREYYALHGKELAMLPDTQADRPSKDYLRWHNENVYLA